LQFVFDMFVTPG